MTLDWWALGLQAINVLILVWLLSRVLWRPVAAAIAARQKATQDMIDKTKAAAAEAEARLAKLTEAREGIAAERESVLERAAKEAASARDAALEEARKTVETRAAEAEKTAAQLIRTARKAQAEQAAQLAVDISAKLLAHLASPAIQAGFLDRLTKAIAEMSEADRAALSAPGARITLVSATDLTDAQRSAVAEALATALGTTPILQSTTDPDLIAGLELHTPHFRLFNSWQADLDALLKELKDAA